MFDYAWQAWPVFLARYYARQLWNNLPGPWWVKVLLVAVCIAIPGPADEIILCMLPGLWSRARAWQQARGQGRRARGIHRGIPVFT